MIFSLLSLWTTLVLFEVINFSIAKYFVNLDIFVPAAIFISNLNYNTYRRFSLAILVGILLGASQEKILLNILVFVSLVYIICRSKEWVLLSSPSFLLLVTGIFLSLKTAFYFIYYRGLHDINSLVVFEYMFNVLLNAIFAYPAFIIINKIYQFLVGFYEKSLHHA